MLTSPSFGNPKSLDLSTRYLISCSLLNQFHHRPPRPQKSLALLFSSLFQMTRSLATGKMTERLPMAEVPTGHSIESIPQLQQDMNHTAFSKDNNTAERQSPPQMASIRGNQAAHRQAPLHPNDVEFLSWLQHLLLVAPLLIAFLYFAFSEPETPREYRNRSAVFIALVGGFCANALDFASQRGFEQPQAHPTFDKWSKEMARISANYVLAIMYMEAYYWLYEGPEGHGEPLAGANGAAWMNRTVWANGTVGVQAPIGFKST
ncbi:hypothetical protein EDD37DRAFT_331951 [Exophiala viscosa]|uniref:uncharacterized protein n=1 Tax=Exophiala viscosa TaxID=2486360 RepID=UPI00218D35ED|nr:hypothetical protein EDD37DRAFT_331951 [Exophiala viscosa]